MNRTNVRKKVYIKRATTVLLFACLLTGAFLLTEKSNGDNLSLSPENEKVEMVTTKRPLMLETSVRRMVFNQPGTKLSLELAAKSGQAVVSASLKSVSATQTKVEDTANAEPTQKAESTQKSEPTPKAEPTESAQPVELEGFEYDADIPMPKAHQSALYKLCKKKGLDYKKALAVIQHESQYDPNEISETNDYGYFQINKVNHADLVKKLNTPNKPLDPFVNIEWGTTMLSDLYAYWQDKGITGDRLDEYVWSSYNKGIGGFREHGKAVTYIKKVREALTEIRTL